MFWHKLLELSKNRVYWMCFSQPCFLRAFQKDCTINWNQRRIPTHLPLSISKSISTITWTSQSYLHCLNTWRNTTTYITSRCFCIIPRVLMRTTSLFYKLYSRPMMHCLLPYSVKQKRMRYARDWRMSYWESLPRKNWHRFWGNIRWSVRLSDSA